MGNHRCACVRSQGSWLLDYVVMSRSFNVRLQGPQRLNCLVLGPQRLNCLVLGQSWLYTNTHGPMLKGRGTRFVWC